MKYFTVVFEIQDTHEFDPCATQILHSFRNKEAVNGAQVTTIAFEDAVTETVKLKDRIIELEEHTIKLMKQNTNLITDMTTRRTA